MLALAATSYADSGIINSTPEGVKYPTVYGKSDRTFLLSGGSFGSFTDNYGYCTQIVINENDFYLHNIIREFPGIDSWVKGTLNAQGEVEFTFPQAVAVDNTGQTLYASMMVAQSSGSTVELVPDAANRKIVMK